MAADRHAENHGLINDPEFDPVLSGFYHSSLADLGAGSLAAMANKFDQITMLDQSQDVYDHYKTFVSTVRLMIDLERTGIKTEFRDNKNNQHILYWHELLRTNKALCLYPWTLMLDNYGHTTVCPKSGKRVSRVNEIEDWQTDPNYQKIRRSMLEGQLLPAHCQECYDREKYGIESTRMFESLEWAAHLRLQNVDDLAKIEHPAFYEIRPSNKCNIMCRMCDDEHSHLIQQEWKKIDIKLTNQRQFQYLTFDQVSLDNLHRIYVGGGEPTVMPEMYDFARRCIDAGVVDFEFCIGTNGMKFSEKLLDLFDHFPNMIFSVSFDGYGRINDYIRWLSDFETIRKNCHRLLERGHTVAFQTVPSIYNASRLHEILEFYDREFPECGMLMQVATFPEDIMSPFNRPDRDVCLESLERCKQTKMYWENGRSIKSIIDSMYDWYASAKPHDQSTLQKFFEFNDKLDGARGSRLEDYIPELAQCRPRA